MTDAKTRIEEIRQRLRDASLYAAFPWEIDEGNDSIVDAHTNPLVSIPDLVEDDRLLMIYEMIAAAPTDIRFLLEEVEKLTWENQQRIQEYILLTDDEVMQHFAVILDYPALIPAALAIRQHLNAWKEKYQSVLTRSVEYAHESGERLREIEALSAQVGQLRQQLDEAQKHARKDAIPEGFVLGYEGGQYCDCLNAVLWGLSYLRRHHMNHNQRWRRLIAVKAELFNLHRQYGRAKALKMALWWLDRADYEKHPELSHADVKDRIAIAQDILDEHLNNVVTGQSAMWELREAQPEPAPIYRDGQDGTPIPSQDIDDIPF